MPGTVRPPHAPADLWLKPDMVDALKRRDFADILKLYRRWTGASQTDISALVGVSQPYVSDVENRKTRVSALDLIERFADGLNAPRHALGLAERHDTGPVDPVETSQTAWREAREFLSRHRSDATKAVYRLYPDAERLGGTGILIPPAWRLPKPIDLSAVHLRWQDRTDQPAVTGGEREARPTRPLKTAGREYGRYHRAMADLARPKLFENRMCYRLLGVNPDEPTQPSKLDLDLTLAGMCYFDMIDVGETLAHEAALAGRAGARFDPDRVTWDRLPFRRLISDPFDLTTYPLMISVSTLTVRASKAGSTFFLLRRNPAKVAIAGGMLSVFPTGVFQPASVVPAPDSPDFDLWRNVMREYSEEYLGNPEHDGDGPPIDYANTEPFRTLDAARDAGRIRVYCLGVGIDTLNYVGDVLTVAVFDADVFDSVFGQMVSENDEGDVDSEEFTFTAECVRRVLDEEPVAPSGAACLQLALDHIDCLT
jgi:transcriptional regulator with XRE-family HTH domain